MARGDVRIAATLACEECKRRNYQTNKSKRNNPERLQLRKYCRWCRCHTAAPRNALARGGDSSVARNRKRAKERRTRRPTTDPDPGAGSRPRVERGPAAERGPLPDGDHAAGGRERPRPVTVSRPSRRRRSIVRRPVRRRRLGPMRRLTKARRARSSTPRRTSSWPRPSSRSAAPRRPARQPPRYRGQDERRR